MFHFFLEAGYGIQGGGAVFQIGVNPVGWRAEITMYETGASLELCPSRL